MRDRNGRQKDPHRKSTLAPHRVVDLGAPVHLGPKSGRHVFGVPSVVGGDVWNLIEEPQPGDSVGVDGIGVVEQLVELNPCRHGGSFLEVEPGPDARDCDGAVAPWGARDELRDIPDRRANRPILAARHVPEDEAHRIDAWEGARHQLGGRQVVGGVVDPEVHGVRAAEPASRWRPSGSSLARQQN